MSRSLSGTTTITSLAFGNSGKRLAGRGLRSARIRRAGSCGQGDREFATSALNRLWGTDLTFVPTWAGVAYVCFIVDAFSQMIVGRRCASNMRTEMVLDAIEMARGSRGHHHEDLRCRSDAGSQFTSIRYSERLTEITATPSIGTVADSYDDAREGSASLTDDYRRQKDPVRFTA